MTRDEAAEILATNKLSFTSTSTEGTDIIIDQMPLPGVEVDVSTKIQLIVQDYQNNGEDNNGEKVLVPNILDRSIQEAHKILRDRDLNIEILGNGISVEQAPLPGEYLNKGDYVTVKFRAIE